MKQGPDCAVKRGIVKIEHFVITHIDVTLTRPTPDQYQTEHDITLPPLARKNWSV